MKVSSATDHSIVPMKIVTFNDKEKQLEENKTCRGRASNLIFVGTKCRKIIITGCLHLDDPIEYLILNIDLQIYKYLNVS